MKLYQGNEPRVGEWKKLAAVNDVDGCGWILFERIDAPEGWRNFKLVAKGKVPTKANYWLSVNVVDGTRHHRDFRLLRDRENLFDWAVGMIAQTL